LVAVRKAGASLLRMVNWALRMKERGAIFLMVGGDVMVVVVVSVEIGWVLEASVFEVMGVVMDVVWCFDIFL
jgi:hypothetical protein